MMNTLTMILFCLLVGAIAAIFWPRRNSQEAKTFVVVTMLTAVAIALADAWKRGMKR